MKYMLLIHQGATPTPPSDAWESLSEDAKSAVYGAYKAINETPGVTPGVQMQPPEMATTVRVQDGKTLTTDGPFAEIKEAIGGYCFFEADDLDRVAGSIPALAIGAAAREATTSLACRHIDAGECRNGGERLAASRLWGKWAIWSAPEVPQAAHLTVPWVRSPRGSTAS